MVARVIPAIFMMASLIIMKKQCAKSTKLTKTEIKTEYCVMTS